MRTLVIGALALILVGCSCALSPQASMEACMDANGLACFDRAAASQPVELNPASVNANSATTPVKSTMATKAEKPSSADARTKDHRTKDHLATKAAKSAVTVAKVEPPASGPPAGNAAASSSTTAASMASSPLKSGPAANSNTGSIPEQMAAAPSVAEPAMAARAVPAPEQKANNTDRPGSSETALLDNAQETAPTSNDSDRLVAILLAHAEIKSVADLTGKIVATDHRQSVSESSVRTAIAAAGATEVQLSEGPAKAIDRVISGEVPAAVLTLVSAETAEWFPEITGFNMFRIPLSPRSAVR